MIDFAAVRIELEDGIVLRPWRLEDAEELFAVVDANREHIGEFLEWVDTMTSVADERSFLEGVEEGVREGRTLELAMVLEAGFIGSIGFNRIERAQQLGEIGYWIAEAHSGRGITTRALRALTRFGFEELGLRRIEITANARNARSRAVAEQAGYRLEGVLRERSLLRGAFDDMVIYGAVASDWPPEG